MSLPRYPTYKDSGVEWLGEVPGHWALARLKGIATFSGGGTPSRENMAFWNGCIPWVSPKDMKSERIVGAEESITNEGLKNSASSVLPPGRVLIVVRSGILQHTIPIAINDVAVALNQDMKAISLNADACQPDFLLRWVQGLNNLLLLVWAKQGATVESIEHRYLADTIVPLPPLAEQAHIAAFLDRETAKIDALVAEQQRLIALLKEKRQAVISHAVTKGLNPDAPMKDSGVEWLGDVPAHWEVAGLTKFLSSIVDYRGRTPTKVEQGTFLVTARNIKNGAIDYSASEEFVLPSEYDDIMRRGKLEIGDVLFTTEAPLGEVANVDRTDVALAQRIIKLRGLPLVLDNLYLKFWMLGGFCQAEMVRLATGSTALGIKGSKVVQLRLCVPSLQEQIEIAAFLTSEIAKLDTLTKEAQRAIDLLQERRTALISAAVTGQIDVRPAAERAAA